MTRRRLQIALGVLWLLDGVLQAQPFMFTRDFATQVIAPSCQGQPGFVAAPVHWVSTTIAAHPVAWNVPFALIQLLLGIGLLVPRTARAALAASIAWALGVWYLGEGLGGLASGDAALSTGAPGSALLLAVLAAAAWPDRDAARDSPAVWVRTAVFEALPHHGNAALAVAEYVVGVGALARPTGIPATALGLALALAFWVVSPDLGSLASGQATDPNTSSVLALMAIALLGDRRIRPVQRRHAVASPGAIT